MSSPVYLPADDFSGSQPPDLDLAADYLELTAAVSRDRRSFYADVIDALELAAETEFADVDTEIHSRETVASGAVERIVSRKRALGNAYPFTVDDSGSVIAYVPDRPDLAQTAYLVSLLLSNLRAITPLLDGTNLHPSDQEVGALREYFQYFATAALAAEIGGPAWSFGFPRPDGSGFIAKLRSIWSIIKDGNVNPHKSAPSFPKYDQVDIFACRERRDGLPGFLLVAAQVATGKDWKGKSIKAHVKSAFPGRWFNPIPATEMVPYHVVPFARPDEQFRDDVLILGNVMHRIRVPHRIAEATELACQGVAIEAFDRLQGAVEWIQGYLDRARRS